MLAIVHEKPLKKKENKRHRGVIRLTSTYEEQRREEEEVSSPLIKWHI